MSCRSNHRLQRLCIAIKGVACTGGEYIGRQVDVAIFPQQVMEKKTFLQRSQGVDVLDVARPARHTGHDLSKCHPG